MSCMGHLHQHFSDLKDKALRSIDQTRAINECLLCRDRLKQIEKHHQDAKKLLSTTKKINQCSVCRETLKAIIVCAKMGHVYASD